MKISVVTLSFNQSHYLNEAVDSVIGQKYANTEYIVVDPGSTDGSRERLREYASGISRLIFEPDRGPSDGLNKGFAAATGDIFCFLNADDYFLPGAFDAVAQHFKTHPDCDVLMGDGRIVDGEGRLLRKIRARAYSAVRHLHGGSSWIQQSTFFRAGIFHKAGGFNIDNRTCWDGELFVMMELAGARFEVIRKELAAFRIHQESITGKSLGGVGVEAYSRDSQRLFELYAGRKADVRDELIKLGYQVERILVHPREIVEALLHRGRAKFR